MDLYVLHSEELSGCAIIKFCFDMHVYIQEGIEFDDKYEPRCGRQDYLRALLLHARKWADMFLYYSSLEAWVLLTAAVVLLYAVSTCG